MDILSNTKVDVEIGRNIWFSEYLDLTKQAYL